MKFSTAFCSLIVGCSISICDGFEKVINSDACREKIEAANMTYMPLNAQETNDILDSMSGNFEKIINAYLNSAN